MTQLKTISLDEIKENPVALRAVNKESEDFIGLVDSMRQKGFLGAIIVRERKIPETDEVYYELVDGLHRYTAAREAGLKQINVDVTSLDDDEVLEAQIMANVHKVETRPVDYTNQLLRILTRQPLMTEAQLAAKLAKSPTWISQRLSLKKLANSTIMELVNDGKINLSNAYSLAKLPPDEQAQYVDAAMTETPSTFIQKVTQRVKDIRSERRKGVTPRPAEFTPIPHMRKMQQLKDMLAEPEKLVAMAKAAGADSIEAGIQFVIEWVLHMDFESVESAREKWNEQQKMKEAQKKAKAAERAEAKAKAAAQAAAEASEEIDDLEDDIDDAAAAADV
jgi:ParB/RepB/Spo0J family partition protein